MQDHNQSTDILLFHHMYVFYGLILDLINL